MNQLQDKFPKLTAVQQAQQNRWLRQSLRFPRDLCELDHLLASRTYILSTPKPALVDVVLFSRIAECNGELKHMHNLVRWIESVQNAIEVPEKYKISVGPLDASAPAVLEKDSIHPGMVDFRVGYILKVAQHPTVDKIYVATVDVGDPAGPRTICTDVANQYTRETMLYRSVVVVANLDPVIMGGVQSTGLILTVYSYNKAELVNPPKDSIPGDKVFFETYNFTPAARLDPDKEIWDSVRRELVTYTDLKIYYKNESDINRPLITEAGEACYVDSLVRSGFFNYHY